MWTCTVVTGDPGISKPRSAPRVFCFCPEHSWYSVEELQAAMADRYNRVAPVDLELAYRGRITPGVLIGAIRGED